MCIDCIVHTITITMLSTDSTISINIHPGKPLDFSRRPTRLSVRPANNEISKTMGYVAWPRTLIPSDPQKMAKGEPPARLDLLKVLHMLHYRIL